jgi:hypothetical protein
MTCLIGLFALTLCITREEVVVLVIFPTEITLHFTIVVAHLHQGTEVARRVLLQWEGLQVDMAHRWEMVVEMVGVPAHSLRTEPLASTVLPQCMTIVMVVVEKVENSHTIWTILTQSMMKRQLERCLLETLM